MFKLQDLLDIDLLQKHIEDGYVNKQTHPVLPLYIMNYSQLAQFSSKWGDGTIDYCRGLIVDGQNNIISRPFKKFHNLNTPSIPETMEANLPTTEPTVTQKLDGSLGIHYAYDGFEGIATRGSFTSPQAKWATANYNARKAARRVLSDNPFSGVQKIYWIPGFTPLFEIIYPENRIVVQYDFSDIVLIGMVDIFDGHEAPYWMLKDSAKYNDFRVVEQLKNIPLDVLKNNNVENEEGYVLSYPKIDEPLKVKVKMADYLRLHRVVTGMNAHSVWELLKTDADLSKFETGYPEHFTKWLKQWVNKLQTQFVEISDTAFHLYEHRPLDNCSDAREYRKKCALYFLAQPRQDVKGLFFMLLDEKGPHEFCQAAWDLIEPRGDDKTFREDGQ